MTLRAKKDNEEIPDVPGVYAFYLKKGCSLGRIEVDESRLLYIGMTKSSLKERDHREHTASSSSTFRRSLGALLKKSQDKPSLKAIPRGLGGSSKDFTNYRFKDSDEKGLTDWMKKNLEYKFEIVENNIEQRERTLISELHPPLNLTNLGGWRNEQKAFVKSLRRICRDEAKRSVGYE
ncbi:hypothetical protein FTO74_09425 [Granulicella sp. WH15]|uniref:GIY-YIG nuclease family protein n=1 Tax=Granulicella sp. WH15 TaxID=2602070 RepID=UPI00136729F4|nr:hypothetical protein [Granulicella sp. WH15]QHN03566.1 hypothetical protein FTO74_09425 [Granulicella sp. WH15]